MTVLRPPISDCKEYLIRNARKATAINGLNVASPTPGRSGRRTWRGRCGDESTESHQLIERFFAEMRGILLHQRRKSRTLSRVSLRPSSTGSNLMAQTRKQRSRTFWLACLTEWNVATIKMKAPKSAQNQIYERNNMIHDIMLRLITMQSFIGELTGLARTD